MAAGQVNAFSVAAIRDRSKDRWGRKRDQVEVFAERAFQRIAESGDVILALNDAEFLTIQPTATRLAALTRTANLLTEILNFFLGSAPRTHMRLFQVVSVADGELVLEPVDATSLHDDKAGVEPSSAASQSACTPLAAALPSRSRKRTRLALQSGLSLEIATSLEPIWNVRGQAVTSALLDTVCYASDEEGESSLVCAQTLFPPEAGEVALETLGQACDLISSDGNMGVHIPLPLHAVSYSTTRYRLLHRLQEVGPEARTRLVLEITEIPTGIPHSRLSEVVAMIAPYGRAVLGRAASEFDNLRTWRRAGLAGVTLDCGRLEVRDRNAVCQLATFAAAAAQVAPACIAYGVASRALLVAAWAAGFTHIGGDMIATEVGSVDRAQRLWPMDVLGLATCLRANSRGEGVGAKRPGRGTSLRRSGV
ncbi:MAG: hypothetical protein ACOY5Y_20510 [Pseudomonadota bacterium]